MSVPNPDSTVVVYSCVTGGYDVVAAAPTSRYRHLLFHDGTVRVPENWHGIRLEVPGVTGIHLNRWAKMLPHRLGLDAERSLYIDGNIVLRRDPADTIDDVLAGAAFAGFSHPQRDCAYVELREAMRLGFVHPMRAFVHRNRFRRLGLPRHAGLVEASLLFRRHSDARVIELDEAWWRWWQRGLLRDQPLLMAAAHETRIRPSLLERNPVHGGDHPVFGIAKHRTKRTRHGRMPYRIGAELMLYRLWAA
jgi:hypothetical protein